MNEIKFCGRPVSREEMDLIQELVQEFWGIARSELASTICELLEWTRPNGKLKTIECIQFLEKLEDQGLFRLPWKRHGRRGKEKPIKGPPVAASVTEIMRLDGGPKSVWIEKVANPSALDLFKKLIAEHHYLGYKTPFGARFRYLVRTGPGGDVLGCLQFSSPAWKVASRDDWIGWDAERRKQHLQLIV